LNTLINPAHEIARCFDLNDHPADRAETYLTRADESEEETDSQKIGDTQKSMRKIGVVVVVPTATWRGSTVSPTEARKLSEAMPPNPGAAINSPNPSGPTSSTSWQHREKTLVGDDEHGKGVGGDDAAQDPPARAKRSESLP